MRVLILGGTTEGRLLAAALAGESGVTTISSLAGRTDKPIIPAGELRIGGFGGIAGLVSYLRTARVDLLVDATHTFARQMTAHAFAAATETGVPLLLLRRPGFVETAGDRWHRVPSLAAAAALVPGLGRRVFLTTGRQEIAVFAGLDSCWFLARSVEPPDPPMPARVEVVLDRGPFSLHGETALMRTHRIEVLISKDSGGPAAKLTAARELGLPVVLVDRPQPPPAPIASTVDEAAAWVRTRSGTPRAPTR